MTLQEIADQLEALVPFSAGIAPLVKELQFRLEVAEAACEVGDLQRLAVNVRHSRILDKETRREAVDAIIALKLIVQGPRPDPPPAQENPPPPPPWPVNASCNAMRTGWKAYFEGKPRDACPFPPARLDLLNAFREGWDAAKEHRP